MQASEIVRVVAAHLEEGEEVPMATLSAGVPFFIVRLTVVCVERRELGVLREFILRAIQSGWASVAEVAGFLGVREQDVQVEIDELSKELFVAVHGKPPKLSLMEKGVRAISVSGLTRVQVREVGCSIHGVTRHVEMIPGELLPRRNLPNSVLVLPAIPARPPHIDEIDVSDIKSSIMTTKNALPRIVEVARLGRIVRTHSLYMMGHLLLRRGVHSVPVVSVNGAVETELAHRLGGHPALQGIKTAIQRHETQVKRTLAQHKPEMRSASFAAPEVVRAALTTFVQYADAIAEKRAQVEKTFVNATDTIVQKSHWLSLPEARVLLARAILCAQKKLIVVAPPLSISLFDFEALENLGAAIKRGVRVELHVLPNDPHFDGRDNSPIAKLKGIFSVPLVAEKPWYGFCCDEDFSVIAATKVLSSSMGRTEAFFGAMVAKGPKLEELLLTLATTFLVPVTVKQKKQINKQ